MKDILQPQRLLEVSILSDRFGLTKEQLAHIFRVKPASIERYFYRIRDKKEDNKNV
jgi:chromosome segregation and condensation protein ScpB